MKILVVDDIKENQTVLKFMVKKCGEVELADDGEIGLRMFVEAREKDKPFDVVFMDIRMPNMDGYQSTKEIRKWEEEHNISDRTPIVIVSGESNLETVSKNLDSLFDLYLSKPIDLPTLLDYMKSQGCGVLQ